MRPEVNYYELLRHVPLSLVEGYLAARQDLLGPPPSSEAPATSRDTLPVPTSPTIPCRIA